MQWRSYLRCAWLSTINVLFYAFTLARFTLLEGRMRRGTYRNWIRGFAYQPAEFAEPTTEAEIIELVKKSNKIRVVGAGHSFNAGLVSDHTLVSLDKYSGLIHKDLAAGQFTFKAGTRIRDVTRLLLADGKAFAALPSHDAQSLAGIISTDVHGTGRDWGFVSQAVCKLKIIDGTGAVCECGPEDDLFKAAIGGIGGVGIITEVTIEAEDHFHVAQKSWIANLPDVEANLDQFIAENDHFSVYIFPFTENCQINTWNRTDAKISLLGVLREFVVISLDSLVAAWLANLFAYTGHLPRISRFALGIRKPSALVLESHAAFNRSIYPLHQELEVAIPYEHAIPTWRRLVQLYEDLYPQGLPYTLIEVRFTPAGHDRTLIGPGRERRTAWIDLICNDSAGYELYYQAAEGELKQAGARPHLGKYCGNWAQSDFDTLHQHHFTHFCQLKDAHDPERKFVNPFLQQLFGNASPPS